MSIEVLFFIAAAMVAFMPTIWDMKGTDNNLNWWNRLTLAGKIYIIAFVSFFGTGLYLTINSHNESVVKEITSKERIKSDSILMSNLRRDVTKLVKSDSLYESAIEKGGFKFDSVNGVIINPQVNVGKDGSAIVNYASNKGLQAARDINFNSEKTLTRDDLDQITFEVKRIMADSSLKCLNVFYESRSNGSIIYNQLHSAFKSQGLSPMGGVSQMKFIEEGITYRIDKNRCLSVIVGYFK